MGCFQSSQKNPEDPTCQTGSDTINPVSTPRSSASPVHSSFLSSQNRSSWNPRTSTSSPLNSLITSLNLKKWPPGADSIVYTDGFENHELKKEDLQSARSKKAPSKDEIEKFTSEVTKIMLQYSSDWSLNSNENSSPQPSASPPSSTPGFSEPIHDLHPISLGPTRNTLPYFKDLNITLPNPQNTSGLGSTPKCLVICKNLSVFSTFIQGKSDSDISICSGCNWQTVSFENGFKGEGSSKIGFTFRLLFEDQQWELIVTLLEIVGRKFEKWEIEKELETLFGV
ncbi:hypothetical protein TrLO_g6264 [Triparma laevis f. longispina]|uniref:Uncharacterized protein n=1 Tax=Triparma laevis f. longispina TaxID=1714387 RepID=A0A9W7EI71_9STRA|nr:hypothetical protein TrLO_g6264 [Triparma laevis f. longispina]